MKIKVKQNLINLYISNVKILMKFNVIVKIIKKKSLALQLSRFMQIKYLDKKLKNIKLQIKTVFQTIKLKRIS